MLNEHYYCKTEKEEAVVTNTATPTEPEPELVTPSGNTDTVEDDIDDLLKDL